MSEREIKIIAGQMGVFAGTERQCTEDEHDDEDENDSQISEFGLRTLLPINSGHLESCLPFYEFFEIGKIFDLTSRLAPPGSAVGLLSAAWDSMSS